MTGRRRIRIVGAGFTGLTNAYYLLRAGFEVEVVEKGHEPGGLIHTVTTPWGLVETAANGLINSKRLEEMAREIQVPLVATRRESRKRFIYRGKPRQWPLSPIETSDMLIRLMAARPRSPKPGETVTVWGRRVVGEKATSFLIEPGLQGVYAGRASQMSASLILSRFFRKSKTKRIKPTVRGTVAPAGGMGDLISGLKRYLVERGVAIRFGENYVFQKSEVTQVVCTSIQTAGTLLTEAAPELGLSLRGVPMVSLATATVFFPVSDELAFAGFGCLFPRSQGFRSLGVLLNHHIFDGRSPHASETWILGGATDPEILNLADRELMEVILTDRKKLKRGDQKSSPLGYRVQRWPQALPHYTTELEHVLNAQAENIRALEKNRIYLAGNYLGGIGLSQILEQAAEFWRNGFKTMGKTGVLLINLGTTAAPTEGKVREYLAEFLMDKWVIDIPFVFRWLLVHGFILRTRPARVAELYKKIWLPEGSPLLHFSEKFAAGFKAAMGDDFEVALGMRYGSPSLRTAIEKLKGVERLVVLPLYPQYSLAATESSIRRVREILGAMPAFSEMPVKFVEPFFADEGFIGAFARNTGEMMRSGRYDHILFSFHGLPERHVRKIEVQQGACSFNENCCAKITDGNSRCYRAQCFATAAMIARKLDLEPANYSVGFQSRLGRTPWIKPHSDVLYGELPKKGIKKLLVVSPSFVADCLETVDEIALRGKEQFTAAGGIELTLVPSLNFNDVWIQAAKKIVLSLLMSKNGFD